MELRNWKEVDKRRFLRKVKNIDHVGNPETIQVKSTVYTSSLHVI